MVKKRKRIKFVFNLILTIVIPILMIVNIISANSEADCHSKINTIRDERTYDYFNLLRLYLINDTQFVNNVGERIVDRTIYLKENKCKIMGLISDISIYMALILYLILLFNYRKFSSYKLN